jgi:hypothetical protein
MRTAFLALTLGLVALGLVTLTPAPASAQVIYSSPYAAPYYYQPPTYYYPGTVYYSTPYYSMPYTWSGNYYVRPWGSGYYYQRYYPWTNSYYYRYRNYPWW